MSDDSLTTRILVELRDEIRTTRDEVRLTNQRIDGLEQRLDRRIDDTNGRIDALRVEVKQQILESEVRLATRMTEQTAATRDLYDLVQGNLRLRDRVEQCEHDIAGLKGRIA